MQVIIIFEFFFQATLVYHVRMHHQNAPKTLECVVCSKSFVDVKRLNAHLKIHSATVASCECPVCKKKYRSVVLLRRHMKYHTEERKFICNLCDKSFSTKNKLQDHENSHYNRKPYGCPFCERAFNGYANYFKHVKRKHENKLNETELKKVPSPRKVREENTPTENQNESGSETLNKNHPVAQNASQIAKNSSSYSTSNQIHQIDAATSNSHHSQHIQHSNEISPSPQRSSCSQQYIPNSVTVLEASSNLHNQHIVPQPVSNNNTLYHSHYSNNHNQHSNWSSGKNWQNQAAGTSGTLSLELMDCGIHNPLGSTGESIPTSSTGITTTSNHLQTSAVLSNNSTVVTSYANNVPSNSSGSHEAHMDRESLVMLNQVQATNNTVTSHHQHLNNSYSTHHHTNHNGNENMIQKQPMELSYKLDPHLTTQNDGSVNSGSSSGFQDVPMELTKVFQRDPLQLTSVRQDFNRTSLMDLSAAREGGHNNASSNGNGSSLQHLQQQHGNSSNLNVHVASGSISMNNNNSMAYHKLADLTERELMDLSGAFRQPIGGFVFLFPFLH